MKFKVKQIVTILVVIFLIQSLVSCGGPSAISNETTTVGTTAAAADSAQTTTISSTTQTQPAEELKNVTLKIYALGGEGGPYAQQVIDEINNYLLETINATIDPAVISWGDWQTKYPAIFASGEAYDLIYASEWCYFKTEAPKGAFMALNDLLPVYAPQTLDSIPQAAWDEATINGKIYLFPTALKEYTTHFALIREDLRKKYDVPEIKSLADIGIYMEAIKQNEPDMVPSQGINTYLFLYENDWGRPLSNDSGDVTYKLSEPDKFFSMVDTPEYEAYVRMKYEWAQNGYWVRNILSVDTDATQEFQAGNIAVITPNLPNCNSVYRYLENANSDFEIMAYDIEGDTKVERSSFIGNGMAVNRNSPNPERAVMLMELVHQDQTLHDLINLGIEGVTYAITDDGMITIPEGADPAQLSLLNLGMGMQDQNLRRPRLGDWDIVDNYEALFDDIAIVNPNCTYIFDREPVNAELAAIVNVCEQYKTPLEAGVVDPDEGLPILREQLKKSGIDKVLAEFERQRTMK